MTLDTPSGRPSHPVLHAVTSAAVALAIGLPFLFILARTAQFYGYADSEFGFWLATRALPGWAVLAILLGVATAFWSANRRRSLGFMLVRSGTIALALAVILTGLSLWLTAPFREAGAEHSGGPPVPLTHFLVRHLLEDPVTRKLTFDPCLAEGRGGAAMAGAVVYEFCIPDSQACRREVEVIDTTVRFEPVPGVSRCGPGRVLCSGTTLQPGARGVLERLSSLPYVRRIRGIMVSRADSLLEGQ